MQSGERIQKDLPFEIVDQDKSLLVFRIVGFVERVTIGRPICHVSRNLRLDHDFITPKNLFAGKSPDR